MIHFPHLFLTNTKELITNLEVQFLCKGEQDCIFLFQVSLEGAILQYNGPELFEIFVNVFMFF